MIYNAIAVLYRNVLYFPGALIMYCYYDPIVTNDTVIVLSISDPNLDSSTIQQNAYQIIANDVNDVTIDNVEYYACAISFTQSMPLDLSKAQSAENPDGNFYLIQLVPADNMDVPY